MIDREVKLANVVEKEGKTVYVISKAGVYFSLTLENIQQLKEIFSEIENSSLICPQE